MIFLDYLKFVRSISESTDHPMIEHNGKMVHKNNSEGKPIHGTDAGIKAFHDWFGGSKSIDKHGRPQVVYHGTDTNFKSVDHKRGAQGTFWFASHKEGVKDSGAASTKIIKPLYVKLHNPAGWNDYDQKGLSELERDGHDGAILSNGDSTGTHVGFVFHGNQVKSAIGNSGAFDKNKNCLNESEVPKEAMIGRVKALHDSGRYDITPEQESNGGIQFHAIAKKPKNAIDFIGRKGSTRMSDKAWHDPEISTLHTDDEINRTHAELKPDSGYHRSVPLERTPGVIYRGMSHEEYHTIKKNGKIESNGNSNLGNEQVGLTYYSRNPSQAESYAHSFANVEHKATGIHHAYIVGVKDPKTEVKVAGTGEDEVGIPHAIDAKHIISVHQGRVFQAAHGVEEARKSWDGTYQSGSGSSPSSSIAWKKINHNKE